MVLIVFVSQICWFFGLHGGFLILNNLPSVSAYSADALGHTILSREFFTVFTTAGGAGMTIGLILALFLFGSMQQNKPLARLSVVPAVFNINETLTYGIPIILNPFYLVPFVLSPVVCGLISYAATYAGWIPHIITETHWSAPVFYAGFVATGSSAGVMMQIFCMFVSAAIYAPFILLKQKIDQKKQQENLKEFQNAAMEAAEMESVSLLLRTDMIGTFAQDFAAEMTRRFDINDIPFHLVYQPKTDSNGKVHGAEALLRWTHPQLGFISPVIIIEISDEAELSTKIGRWVFDRATDQLAAWRESGEVSDIALSINLNPRHLHDDPDFCDYIVSETDRKGIPRSLIELEITEHNAIHSGSEVPGILKSLKEAGFALSIDDLGMGYSSLTYISDFGASVVKIDKSIADGVVDDEMLREIVSSVLHLAHQLDLQVLVEGVEDAEQVALLSRLGVHYYQGYYFSKPLSAEDFVSYCAEHGYSEEG
jgi:EAL domain-containing protein (putative c-di-GMP-specific phosphodiesterase class I)